MPAAYSTPRLPSPKSAGELLELYFLDARSHLLECAAILDRIERADGAEEAMGDPRVQKLLRACTLLGTERGDRAERFQLLFSEPAE